MAKRKGTYSNNFNQGNMPGQAPIKFHPFPWKISFEGIVDGYGEKVIDCKPEISKIIVEAVNKQNKPIPKRRKKRKR